MPGSLAWPSADRCAAGDRLFQLLPEDFVSGERDGRLMEGADLFLFKTRPMVDRYLELIEQLQPRHIFELGVFTGGSTAFLAEVARPRKLVAIDRDAPRGPGLAEYVESRSMADVVRVMDGVDQADRGRLAVIVADEFGQEPLDLVIDDCSHLYEPTRASFNELFPRLRPGGVYVIEDWRWAHAPAGAESLDGMWPDEVPLTRLVLELVLALPSVPDLIADLRVGPWTVEVSRGPGQAEPATFDVSACATPRGRSLLAG